jgi:hypothetical protein
MMHDEDPETPHIPNICAMTEVMVKVTHGEICPD